MIKLQSHSEIFTSVSKILVFFLVPKDAVLPKAVVEALCRNSLSARGNWAESYSLSSVFISNLCCQVVKFKEGGISDLKEKNCL